MDLQKPLLCGPLTGFSKPRAKMTRKPRSATLLNEFVSFLQPSDFSKEVENLYSLNSLQRIYTEEDALETNANLTMVDTAWVAKEEMNSANRNLSSGRHVPLKNSDVHAGGKLNNSLKDFYRKGNEQTSSGRIHKKENKLLDESAQAGSARIGDSDQKAYGRSTEGKRPEPINREASYERAFRGKPAKLTAEGTGSVSKEDASARLSQEQRGIHEGNKDLRTEHQVGKYGQEAPPQVGRPTKLKLKVGGVTHTLQTFLPEQKLGLKKTSDAREASKPESKKRRQRLILQGVSDDEDTDIPAVERPRQRSTKQGIVLTKSNSQKKFTDGGNYSKIDSFYEQMDLSKCDRNLSTSPSAQPVRKSSRVVKKRSFDVEEEGVLESEKKSRRKAKEDEDELYKDEDEENAGYSEREASSEADMNSLDDEEHGSYKPLRNMTEQVGSKKKKVAHLTARQRALQSCKEHGYDLGTSWIEFPDGVSSSTQRKSKVRLTEEEIQAKRAEAARRRKQQSEKAARDIQASAIHKILSQDSVRKKREESLQKQREEIALSKKAAELEVASKSIRWTYGPNGTLVSWSKDVELPALFKSGPCSYPPPREKCIVPTCNNTYKYRHSKLKLPLCSLQCYRMVETPNEVGSTF